MPGGRARGALRAGLAGAALLFSWLARAMRTADIPCSLSSAGHLVERRRAGWAFQQFGLTIDAGRAGPLQEREQEALVEEMPATQTWPWALHQAIGTLGSFASLRT